MDKSLFVGLLAYVMVVGLWVWYTDYYDKYKDKGQ